FLDRKVEASLKQRIHPPRRCCHRRFLDRKVEASLKHGGGVAVHGAELGIPRPKGRGLIEATHAPCRLQRWARIPRPKGRGLIEAWWRGSGARCRTRDSSTERSRPH